MCNLGRYNHGSNQPNKTTNRNEPSETDANVFHMFPLCNQ